MHDLSGPVMLLLGAAAGSIHLLGAAKPLIGIASHTLICASMLIISLAGVGQSSRYELVVLGWVLGGAAMLTVAIATFRARPRAP